MLHLVNEGADGSSPRTFSVPEIGNCLPDFQLRLHVARACSLGLPEIAPAPPALEPVILVGGGPSLKRMLLQLRMHQLQGVKIVACGSVHDFLIDHGIIPWACTLLDPQQEMANFVTKARDDVQYLVASQCHPVLFDALKGRQVLLWHAEVGVENPGFPPDRIVIGGGCTIVLRSIWLMGVIGFREFHMYGFDGCDDPETGDHHAYGTAPDGDAHEYRVGSPDGPKFIVRGSLIGQADGWARFLKEHGHHFKFTIYGGGLMAEIGRLMSTTGEST